MPFNVDQFSDTGGLLTGNGLGSIGPPAGPVGGKNMMAGVEAPIFSGMQGVDFSAPQIPNVPSIPGNPTGTNNVPGGITGAPNPVPFAVNQVGGVMDDSAPFNIAPTSVVNKDMTTGLVGPGGPGSVSSMSDSITNLGLAPGAIATTNSQGGVGGNAVATSTGGSQSTQSNYAPTSAFDVNGQNPTDIGAILSKILNIPNTVTPAAPQINSVTGQPASVSAPTPISANFPANGIDNSGTPPGNLDLGALLGIKQNTNLPAQLDDIYGKGFGDTYAKLLQNGGGFNPDINNALINAMRPQENRAFDNIRQTMANAGLSPSGSPFALAAGDFWSQVANNENATIANNFNQAVDRTHNLFGQGLEAAQLAQANKMGPLQWLSALSPLLGPLISGLASKIPSINVNTSSQGGQSTASGTGGQGGTSRSTSRGGGASTTNTNTNTPTATGGTATASPTISPTISNRNRSQVNPTVSSNSNPYINYNPYNRIDPQITSSNESTSNPYIDYKPYNRVDPEITSSNESSSNPYIDYKPYLNAPVSPTITNTSNPYIENKPYVSGTVSPTLTNTNIPTFENKPYIAPEINPTISTNPVISPVISPAINPSILGTVSPTFQNTPTFTNNPSIHVDPTISNTSSNDAHINPVISPAISPTMINSMGGLPNLPGGGVSPIPPPIPVGSLPPSNLPPGFPPGVSPGQPPSTGTRIGFPGGPMGPTGVGNAPPPPPGGYGNMPWGYDPTTLEPYFGPGTSSGYPYDPGPPSVGNFPYPAGVPGNLPGLEGTPSTNPALNPNGWGGPYIPLGPDPYQQGPVQNSSQPGGGADFNQAQYNDGPNPGPFAYPDDPFGYTDPWANWGGGGGWKGWGAGWDLAAGDGNSLDAPPDIFEMMGI